MSTQAVTVQGQFDAKVPELVERAKAIVITDQETYNSAAAFLKEVILPMEDEIEKELGAAKKKTHEAWKDASDRYNRYMNPVTEARKTIGGSIGTWDLKQKQLQEAETRRLQEEADRLEQENRANEAIAAEEAGASKKEVNAILNTPIATPQVKAAPTYTPAAGVSTREGNWAGVCDNVALVILYVAKNPAYRSLLKIDQVALNNFAKAQKGNMKIPGCRAVQAAPVIATRR